MNKSRILYCTVLFEKKKAYGLTLNEYVFLDMVFHLSSKTGWCYSSKEYFAETLDLSRQSIFNLIKKLTDTGWLEKDEASTNLRTTEKWNQVYMEESKNDTGSKDSLRYSKDSLQDSKLSLQDSKDSLLNNNIYINNKNTHNKNTPDAKASEKKETYIQKLFRIFSEEYKKVRGYDFETDTVKKEENAIGKLANGFKKRNPGKTTVDAIDFFTDYFIKCLQIENDFLKRTMSPSLILNQKTQINAIIKSGNYGNNNTKGNNIQYNQPKSRGATVSERNEKFNELLPTIEAIGNKHC